MYLNKISKIGLAACFACQSLYSQVVLEGDLHVKDNPETASVLEGNLKVDGSLVISDAGDFETHARGLNSVAIGRWARAYGPASIAISNTGNNYYSAKSYGPYSIAIGEYARAGNPDEENAEYSFAYGHHAYAKGRYSIAIGLWSWADTVLSIAIGNGANATGHISTAIGYGAKSSGYMSMSYGRQTVASGESAVAMGNNNTALGRGSMALGHYSTTGGVDSYTLGFRTQTKSFRETVIGTWNDTAAYSGNIGTWRETDSLFVIGNGLDEENKSNALVMLKNGNTTLNGHLEADSISVKTPRGGISMGDFGRSE